MTQQDQAEREAAGLIEAVYRDAGYHPQFDAVVIAVAAKLRSLYAEIERLEKLNGDYASIISEVTEQRDQWKVPAEIAKKLANQLQDDNARLSAQLAEAEAEIERLDGHLPDCCKNETCDEEENILHSDVVAQTMNTLPNDVVQILGTNRYIDLADKIGDLAHKAVKAAIKEREAEIDGLKQAEKQRDEAQHVAGMDRGKLWLFMRHVLEQGSAIQQDYATGNYKNYEEFSARVDAAARERVDQFVAAIEAKAR